jgi:hypothetical protein
MPRSTLSLPPSFPTTALPEAFPPVGCLVTRLYPVLRRLSSPRLATLHLSTLCVAYQLRTAMKGTISLLAFTDAQ